MIFLKMIFPRRKFPCIQWQQQQLPRKADGCLGGWIDKTKGRDSTTQAGNNDGRAPKQTEMVHLTRKRFCWFLGTTNGIQKVPFRNDGPKTGLKNWANKNRRGRWWKNESDLWILTVWVSLNFEYHDFTQRSSKTEDLWNAFQGSSFACCSKVKVFTWSSPCFPLSPGKKSSYYK